jgi:hypothetical protein
VEVAVQEHRRQAGRRLMADPYGSFPYVRVPGPAGWQRRGVDDRQDLGQVP